MATDIAKQLIYDLRNDAHTREHFSIVNWHGKNTCGTVGCIAGTAVYRDKQTSEDRHIAEILKEENGNFFIDKGQEILGIPYRETARHLFIPTAWIDDLRYEHEPFDFLPAQAQPVLDTVNDMKQWAETFRMYSYTESMRMLNKPDMCANALEQVTVEELPYVNWKRAYENA